MGHILRNRSKLSIKCVTIKIRQKYLNTHPTCIELARLSLSFLGYFTVYHRDMSTWLRAGAFMVISLVTPFACQSSASVNYVC